MLIINLICLLFCFIAQHYKLKMLAWNDCMHFEDKAIDKLSHMKGGMRK